jgi:RNA polymerase sporulation-specific sigma factor
MKYNDYELVAMAQEHNEDATNMLYEKYRPLIVKKSREVYRFVENKGVDINDVIQEALIGFEEAIRSFDQNDKALFYTFATICLDRQLKSMVLKFSRDKHRILNEAISFDDVGEEVNILDFIYDDNDNPENELLSEEATEELIKNIGSILTTFELEVFKLRIMGYNNRDIAVILNKDVKSISNTLQRIKMKLRKLYD